jgi:imidazolonepropionase-like amidohydrolase
MQGKYWICVVLFGLLGCSHKQPAPPATEGTFAFVDVTVVPMDSERLLPGQTVLVREGRITHMGSVESVSVPAGAQRIDGRGKYLMPGLSDMHSHPGSEEDLRLMLANGVTFSRVMWGTPQELRWRERIARGELLGPTLFVGGPLVDGNPPYWKGSAVASTFADAERIVAEHKKAGFDFIKVYALLSLDAYKGVAAASKQQGIPFAGHVPGAVRLDDAAKVGQRSAEHLFGLYAWAQTEDSPYRGQGETSLNTIFSMGQYIDMTKVAQAATLLKQGGVWSCPTLIAYEAFSAPEVLEEMAKRPELRYVSPRVLKMWSPKAGFRMQTLSSEEQAAVRRGEENRLGIVRALHEAGAPLLLGTDANIAFVVPGFSVARELGLYVKAGLSPYEALRAGTRGAAEFAGLLDERGTVEPNKQADLLLLEANPLENVAHVQRISGVLAKGRWFPASELQRMLEEVAKAAAEDRIQANAPLFESFTGHTD